MNRPDNSHARLRRRIFGAVGLSTAMIPLAMSESCGGIAVIDGDGSGGAGGAGSVSATQSGGPTVSVSNASSVSSGSGMTNDCMDYAQGEVFPVPPNVCDYDPEFWQEGYYCFDAPPGGCGTFSDQCILDSWSCGLASTAEKIACSPAPNDNMCCYLLLGGCPVGRPLTIDGFARVANAACGTGWSVPQKPRTAELSATSRKALADVWLREGLAEHASVASFSRFVMQLLAIGAPASLVRDAQRAAMEETGHAEICFGLASAYADQPMRPGPLDLDGVLNAAMDRDTIVLSAAAEGCIAETVSAMIIANARDAATDPAVKQALTTVADEEAAHAELAWRLLRWCLEQPGDQQALRDRLGQVFDDAANHVGCGVVTDIAADTGVLRAHGYLSLTERRQIAAQTLATIVLPAATALLARHPKLTPASVEARAAAV